MEKTVLLIIPLLLGYLLDLILGDPEGWPHPVRLFGNAIAGFESRWNKGKHRFIKGALGSFLLVSLTFALFWILYRFLMPYPYLLLLVHSIFVWYGLANKGLIVEGRNVFTVLEKKGLLAGRKQLARIVGRDTSNLSEQQIRIATLETMSENLSDGVIAPLFYYVLGGIPGMMAYKIVNTLDSMIGYRSPRYEYFGKFAARLDDIANFVPARLTALLMVAVTLSGRGFRFVGRYARAHSSPNAGYPEAALAGILHCRFGGPNWYHGQLKDKPFIGSEDRLILPREIDAVVRINHAVCLAMVALSAFALVCYHGAIHL